MTPFERSGRLPRGGVALDVVRHVRLSFSLENDDSPEAKLVPIFRCSTCDEPFVRNPVSGWWECSLCGIELSRDELVDLSRAVEKSLKQYLNLDAGLARGGRWHWLQFLRQLIQRRR